MLTISIHESLAGNPDGWSEWNDTGNMYMTGLDGLSEQPCHKWEREHDRENLPWQVPQKTPVRQAPPLSSWASPLRVPLPAPVNEEPFSDTLDLPPHLSSIVDQFSDLDPAWPEEKPIEFFQPPPGLTALAAEQPLAGLEAKEVAMEEVELAPGIKIFSKRGTCRVEWRIDDLNGKLQASMARPLVSPPFAAQGLPNLRLMVFPDGREVMKNARSSERKGLYTHMIKKGPLNGALKLKADCLQCATVMTVNLIVGQVCMGPLVYDFSEQAIHGLDDFGIDWLKQVDKSNGSLTVGIEILDVRPQP
mmetsp:Transcript_52205/g.124947  ORF Transcript_52205/g.124947 Transcript_52205/m.124947 type:complete len:305 (+) Transcript_52205:75-989(+)